MTQVRSIQALSTLALTAMLAACGGGGDSGTTTPPVGKAEGVYGGTLTGSSSPAFQMLVLEDDSYWALYGQSTAGTFFVAGFIQGQGASNNGTFTSSTAKDFGFVPPVAGTITATYVPDTSVNGTISAGGQTVTFAGAPIAGSTYDYNTAAVVSTIAGPWTLTALDGSTVTLSVGATGAFTGTSVGCTMTGTLTPRASGKNVFDLALTFGGAPCALPNQTATGIALSYPLTSGQDQLIVAGVDGTRAHGTALFGTR